MTEDRTRLIHAAREAATRAHAPYSRFAVGAALLMTDGSLITGANVENASYGLSLCARRWRSPPPARPGGCARWSRSA